MFKRTSLMALLIGSLSLTLLPSAEVEAGGYKSSRSSSSSFRSSSRSTYSAPKYSTMPRSTYRPAASAQRSTPYSKPSAAASRPNTGSVYNRPATGIGGMRANDRTYRGQSATNGYRKPIQGMKSTPYGNRPSGYAPRRVTSPLASRGYAPRTTVIQKNYYGGNRYGGGYGGYNRGYGGGYGGGMMGGQGPGLGSMLLAGAGGAILGNMLYNGFSHTPSAANSNYTRTTETVTPVQADQIRQEQRIEDKLDQVNEKLDAQPVAMAGPQGYSLPPDAPLMMSPDFYKLGGSM